VVEAIKSEVVPLEETAVTTPQPYTSWDIASDVIKVIGDDSNNIEENYRPGGPS
jgi:hypothetical protein